MDVKDNSFSPSRLFMKVTSIFLTMCFLIVLYYFMKFLKIGDHFVKPLRKAEKDCSIVKAQDALIQPEFGVILFMNPPMI